MNKFFPDWRRVLNELQRYSASGTIDAGVLGRYFRGKYKRTYAVYETEGVY